MKSILSIAVLVLVLATGCDKLGKSVSDLDRLGAIDDQVNRGDYEASFNAATAYVKDHPECAQGWCLLGWAQVKTDRIVDGNISFDKALRLDSSLDNAYVGKGVGYRSLGDNDNARKCYLKAIDIVPENAEAYSSLLVIELLEGDDDKAVEYGEKAWNIRKDLASVPANLSIAYHYQGNMERRDYYFTQAEKLGYHNINALPLIFSGEVSLR